MGIFYLRCAQNWEVLIPFCDEYLLIKYSQYNNYSTLVLYTILFLHSKSISRVWKRFAHVGTLVLGKMVLAREEEEVSKKEKEKEKENKQLYKCTS